MRINQRGFWENETTEGHCNDTALCSLLVNFLKDNEIKKLLDLGCGPAFYVSEINKQDIECEAYDGNPNTPELTKGLGKVLDLSKDIDLGKTFDFVLSLEVGEHIPKEFEEIYINNVIKHSHNYILLSWAIKGQGGDGHINEQDNEYIINKVTSFGFKYQEEASSHFRNSAELSWFKNTLMLFKK
jgi:cyclopropane fatty-acyl-phospholipid synthase-like methyltransferase